MYPQDVLHDAEQQGAVARDEEVAVGRLEALGQVISCSRFVVGSLLARVLGFDGILAAMPVRIRTDLSEHSISGTVWDAISKMSRSPSHDPSVR